MFVMVDVKQQRALRHIGETSQSVLGKFLRFVQCSSGCAVEAYLACLKCFLLEAATAGMKLLPPLHLKSLSLVPSKSATEACDERRSCYGLKRYC